MMYLRPSFFLPSLLHWAQTSAVTSTAAEFAFPVCSEYTSMFLVLFPFSVLLKKTVLRQHFHPGYRFTSFFFWNSDFCRDPWIVVILICGWMAACYLNLTVLRGFMQNMLWPSWNEHTWFGLIWLKNAPITLQKKILTFCSTLFFFFFFGIITMKSILSLLHASVNVFILWFNSG